MNRISQESLIKFLLIHEKDIEMAGKFNPMDEWSLLYLVFKEAIGRFAGKKEFGK